MNLHTFLLLASCGLASLTSSLAAQCTQQQQIGTWGPTGVSWPTFTCTINCPGATTNRTGAIAIPKYNGPGQLTQVTIQLAWSVGGSYSGNHTGGQFAGIISELDTTFCFSAPGVAQQCCSTNAVTSAPSPTQFPLVGFGLNPSGCQIGPINVPASSFAQYTGTGSFSIPITASFLQRVYISSGSITGQYALGQNTLATATVTYCATEPGTVTVSGTGCPGTNGLTPQPSTNVAPNLGSAGFAFTIASGLPGSSALVCVADATANIALGGGCTLLIDPAFSILPTVTLDGAGNGVAPFPIPATSSLYGALVYSQTGVLDPNGACGG
ncbi:MAG: choice-of-anchor E domain-containing protein, partial [Planctomycetes bacterium]|nr:choice-of-anchor E domain-containing protein [Planctomycetota bacterium]